MRTGSVMFLLLFMLDRCIVCDLVNPFPTIWYVCLCICLLQFRMIWFKVYNDCTTAEKVQHSHLVLVYVCCVWTSLPDLPTWAHFSEYLIVFVTCPLGLTNSFNQYGWNSVQSATKLKSTCTRGDVYPCVKANACGCSNVGVLPLNEWHHSCKHTAQSFTFSSTHCSFLTHLQ